MTETKRLGRGLEALLGPISKDEAIASGGLREIAVTAIAPNPYQPRREFEEAPLQELADSIAASGLLQPVVVRARPNGRYELIAGERRWRAVQRLGWQKIPAVIKDTADENMLRDALLENLHRSQLNPLEEASAYQQLLGDFGITQEELAARIGRSRPQISNTLRLLKLPEPVQLRVARARPGALAFHVRDLVHEIVEGRASGPRAYVPSARPLRHRRQRTLVEARRDRDRLPEAVYVRTRLRVRRLSAGGLAEDLVGPALVRPADDRHGRAAGSGDKVGFKSGQLRRLGTGDGAGLKMATAEHGQRRE